MCIASSDEVDCTEWVLRQVTRWIVQDGYCVNGRTALYTMGTAPSDELYFAG